MSPSYFFSLGKNKNQYNIGRRGCTVMLSLLKLTQTARPRVGQTDLVSDRRTQGWTDGPRVGQTDNIDPKMSLIFIAYYSSNILLYKH